MKIIAIAKVLGKIKKEAKLGDGEEAEANKAADGDNDQ